MKSFWIIITIICVASGSSDAQIYAYKKRSELFLQLKDAGPDSNKVFLLLNISNAYIKGNMPDSSLVFSARALQLSRSLGMTDAYDQGSFFACKASATMGDMRAAEAIMEKATGEWKVKMAQQLAEYYAFRPGNLPANLDSAWPYIQKVVSYSDAVHTTWAIQNARVVLGKYYFQRGELQKGIDCFNASLREDQAAGDKAREAKCWSMLGSNLPSTFGTMPLFLHADSMAMQLYGQAGDKENVLYSLEDLSTAHWAVGQFKIAEQEQIRVNNGMIALGKKKMYSHFGKHAIDELYLGNHARALELLFLAKKNMDSLEEDYLAGQIDKQLGNVYWAENNIDQSLYWYQVSLQETQGKKDLTIYGTALRIVKGLILKDRLSAAHRFLIGFQQENPPVRSRDKEMMAAARGALYEALGQKGEAEKYYLDMVRFGDLAIADEARDIDEIYDIARPEAYYTMGKFYVDTRQFSKARPFLQRVLTPICVMPVTIDILRDDHLLLYKVDSAAGDLASAIKHRLLYEKYSDSIFTDNKARQLAETQVRYESDKKDQNIALLGKQQQLDKAELSRAALIRNISFAGLFAALIIIGLLYNQYRVKQKSNRAINVKNEALGQLVKEKEWLLKEIHHRVKNNLQTVVSLLDSQSAYLSNEALQAIRDSQNRVFSISLIHQKLYQTENAAFIGMSSYLPELVNYLRDIYDIRNQIAFQLDIAQIELDISQAVSIGLILNEALTNAIKHAFPERKKGNTIVVEMIVGDHNIVYLKIADNGIGLPKELDPERQNSLGLKLMKGLTGDLGGSFSIESQNGTTIYIRFVANVPFESAIKIIASSETTI
ncbi:MAG TPA: sensor histidine kinase [Puia sp.]|jgi:two-component sensor histidine kinase